MLPPEKLITPKACIKIAINQSPLPTRYNPDVINVPKISKKNQKFFFINLRSAIDSSIGAASAMNKLPIEFQNPRMVLLKFESTPALKYCLKKIEKNPAITVIVKAELAQSYIAQPHINLRSWFIILLMWGKSYS